MLVKVSGFAFRVESGADWSCVLFGLSIQGRSMYPRTFAIRPKALGGASQHANNKDNR